MIELIYNDKKTADYFQEIFSNNNISFRLNDLRGFRLDLHQPPDEVLYLNQIEANYTEQGETQTMLLLEQYLEYLATYNRRVVNNVDTLLYEVEYFEKLRLLKRLGLNYPPTVFSSDYNDLYNKVSSINPPVHIFSDRSQYVYGKERHDTLSTLHAKLISLGQNEFNEILFVQQYIQPQNNQLHKVFFIKNKIEFAGVQDIDTGIVTECDLPAEQIVKKFQILNEESKHQLLEFSYVIAKNKALYILDFTGKISFCWDRLTLSSSLSNFLIKSLK